MSVEREDTIAALKADVEHWKGVHASACVSMIHYVPAFGSILDAITILGERAIAAEAKCDELQEQRGTLAATEKGFTPLGQMLSDMEQRAIAAEARLEAAEGDARRYRFLKPLYHSIDFEYDNSSEGPTPSIVFAIPPGTRWSGDLDSSIDVALKERK